VIFICKLKFIVFYHHFRHQAAA